MRHAHWLLLGLLGFGAGACGDVGDRASVAQAADENHMVIYKAPT